MNITHLRKTRDLINNRHKLGKEMMVGDIVKLNCNEFKKEGLVNGMIFKIEKINNETTERLDGNGGRGPLINDKFKNIN